MEFEWDPKKAEINQRKHRVSFHEGASVFGDPLAITFPDTDHSEDEERYITFNARRMSRNERKIYEEGQIR